MQALTQTLLALALAVGASSCQVFTRARGVTFASDPPGARVILNGKDSGFVTPCILDIENDEDQHVEFKRPGYKTATWILVPNAQRYAILWSEMYLSHKVWRLPIWLNIEDFFVPIKVIKDPAPARLFVRLDREADQ